MTKHIGMYERQTVYVLGYNKAQGKFAIFNPAILNANDAKLLADVVNDGYAQSRDILLPALQRELHPNGIDWLSYIAPRVLEVPAHTVTLSDKGQAHKLTGTTSNYDVSLDKDARAGRTDRRRSPQDALAEAAVAPVQAPPVQAAAPAADSAKLDFIMNEIARLGAVVAALQANQPTPQPVQKGKRGAGIRSR